MDWERSSLLFNNLRGPTSSRTNGTSRTASSHASDVLHPMYASSTGSATIPTLYSIDVIGGNSPTSSLLIQYCTKIVYLGAVTIQQRSMYRRLWLGPVTAGRPLSRFIEEERWCELFERVATCYQPDHHGQQRLFLTLRLTLRGILQAYWRGTGVQGLKHKGFRQSMYVRYVSKYKQYWCKVCWRCEYWETGNIKSKSTQGCIVVDFSKTYPCYHMLKFIA